MQNYSKGFTTFKEKQKYGFHPLDFNIRAINS